MKLIGDVQLPLIVPMLYFLIVTLLVAVPLITKPKESATGLAMMIGSGIPYYLLVISWTSKPAALVNTMGMSVATDCYDVCTFYALNMNDLFVCFVTTKSKT